MGRRLTKRSWVLNYPSRPGQVTATSIIITIVSVGSLYKGGRDIGLDSSTCSSFSFCFDVNWANMVLYVVMFVVMILCLLQS
mgnify:CR=1 FL=1